jgi:hypothetical protein
LNCHGKRLQLLFWSNAPGIEEGRAMEREQWELQQKNHKYWAIRITFEVLASKAYLALNYGPALKILNWIYEKMPLEKVSGKKGKKRYRLKGDGGFSFTYKEAMWRGLSCIQFRKGLKKLYSHGFIDVSRPGSSLRGDFSEYLFSERWRLFGQPGFEYKEFPVSVHRITTGFKPGNKLWMKRREREDTCLNQQTMYC